MGRSSRIVVYCGSDAWNDGLKLKNIYTHLSVQNNADKNSSTNVHLSVSSLKVVMRRVLCLDDTERTAATYLTSYISNGLNLLKLKLHGLDVHRSFSILLVEHACRLSPRNPLLCMVSNSAVRAEVHCLMEIDQLFLDDLIITPRHGFGALAHR